jgi:hypothetical protein
MPRVYELPTHLEVEDQLIAGLTVRQLVRLAIGASLAYGVWDQVAWLPQEVRLSLAGVLMILGIVFALVRPSTGSSTAGYWRQSCLSCCRAAQRGGPAPYRSSARAIAVLNGLISNSQRAGLRIRVTNA